VLDEGGSPLKDAHVMLRGANPLDDDSEADWVPTAMASAGKDGRLAFKGLPGVQVHLSVSLDGYIAASQVAAAGLGEVEFRLVKQDPGAAARLEAIGKELMELYTAIGSAKDDKERGAVAQRIQALNAEKAKLSGE
jgi:hypothetical protein